jgi:hypothetical protein
MEGEGGRGRGGRRRRSRGETGGWKYRQRDGGEAEHSTLERRTYSTVCIGSLQAEEATAGTPPLGCGAPNKYCGVPWAQNLAALDSETLSSDPSERPKTKVSGKTAIPVRSCLDPDHFSSTCLFHGVPTPGRARTDADPLT